MTLWKLKRLNFFLCLRSQASRISVSKEVLQKAAQIKNLEECTKFLLLQIIPEEEIAKHSLSGRQPAVNQKKGITACRPRVDIGKITRVRGNIQNFILSKIISETNAKL